METCSPFTFKYNMHEAINLRGRTPDDCFGCVGDNVTIFDFYSSCNAAQIDEEFEYHIEGYGELREKFGIDDSDRKLTKKEWKKGMSGWRKAFPKDDFGYEPDLNPGGGSYHM